MDVKGSFPERLLARLLARLTAGERAVFLRVFAADAFGPTPSLQKTVPMFSADRKR